MVRYDLVTVTRETLPHQLFDAGLAPDGVTPVSRHLLGSWRFTRKTRLLWLPASEIADVWHLVLRYRMSITFSCAAGGSRTVHALTREGTPKRLGIARLVHDADIALAIGRLALTMRQYELTEEQEATDGRNG